MGPLRATYGPRATRATGTTGMPSGTATGYARDWLSGPKHVLPGALTRCYKVILRHTGSTEGRGFMRAPTGTHKYPRARYGLRAL